MRGVLLLNSERGGQRPAAGGGQGSTLFCSDTCSSLNELSQLLRAMNGKNTKCPDTSPSLLVETLFIVCFLGLQHRHSEAGVEEPRAECRGQWRPHQPVALPLPSLVSSSAWQQVFYWRTQVGPSFTTTPQPMQQGHRLHPMTTSALRRQVGYHGSYMRRGAGPAELWPRLQLFEVSGHCRWWTTWN
ncbi:hypothetical protein DPEC_G00370360 [Dallia pectoralis]|nr:hypothetical protein DPEC_G00370360 [Dallia pectoralis]